MRVCYSKEPDGHVWAKTHGFISDDSTPIMLKENNTAKHFWSDRCVGQFKNKFLKRFMKEKAKKKRTNILFITIISRASMARARATLNAAC